MYGIMHRMLAHIFERGERGETGVAGVAGRWGRCRLHSASILIIFQLGLSPRHILAVQSP